MENSLLVIIVKIPFGQIVEQLDIPLTIRLAMYIIDPTPTMIMKNNYF